MPRRFEFTETPLPKTGTGKIIKRELRESFWSGKEKPGARMMTLIAAIPIFVLLLLHRRASQARLDGVPRRPLGRRPGRVRGISHARWRLIATVTYGAAFGLFPIGWVVFAAILLYRIILETGKFDILKDSIGHLTDDPKLQALLIAFAFGAFVEGAAGFGTPVAVAAAMLTGLGFSPFYAASICLLANTAPVAFGSIGIPITTLAVTTGLPVDRLSAGVGRICAPVSLIVPAYLIVVMSGWKGLRPVLVPTLACGIAFAGTQFAVSNFIGPQLTDILSSLAAIIALLVCMPRRARRSTGHSSRDIFLAWAPYGLLVVFVLLWGYKPLQLKLDSLTIPIHWPGLADKPPYKFTWLAASGHRLSVRGDPRRFRHRPEPAAIRQSLRPHRQAARPRRVDPGLRPRPGVHHELLRRDRHARSRFRRHRRECSRSSARCSAGSASSSPAATPPPTRCSAPCRWSRPTSSG